MTALERCVVATIKDAIEKAPDAPYIKDIGKVTVIDGAVDIREVARRVLEAIFAGSSFREFNRGTLILNPEFSPHFWDGEKLEEVPFVERGRIMLVGPDAESVKIIGVDPGDTSGDTSARIIPLSSRKDFDKFD